MIRLLALRTKRPNQPLRHHRLNRRCHQERLHAHVDQTRNRARGIVCMKRAENKVARQRGLNRDFRHFQIADFADQNDIGRLAKHGPENPRKAQPDRIANLALVDPREIVFHRVFSRDDLFIGTVQFVQGTVQCGGFARAGRPGDQENTVGPFDDLLENPVILFLKPHVRQADAHGIRPQNTQHDRFTVIRRQSADAEVDLALIDHQLDSTILRQALLRDINARHDLQTAGQRPLHPQRNLIALHAFTINPIPHPNPVLHRLNMNIARPVPHGFGNHRLHQLDDRCLRRVVHHIFAHPGDVDRFINRLVQ